VCKREVDVGSLGLGLEDEQELLRLVQNLVNVNVNTVEIKVNDVVQIPVDDQMRIRPVYPEGRFF
jgi:hypothetical protein